jgi:hypothetical protein
MSAHLHLYVELVLKVPSGALQRSLLDDLVATTIFSIKLKGDGNSVNFRVRDRNFSGEKHVYGTKN